MGVYIRDLPEAKIEDLSDRELLELTCRTVNQLKGLLIAQQAEIDALKNWRNVVTGGITVAVVMGGWIMAKMSKLF